MQNARYVRQNLKYVYIYVYCTDVSYDNVVTKRITKLKEKINTEYKIKQSPKLINLVPLVP